MNTYLGLLGPGPGLDRRRGAGCAIVGQLLGPAGGDRRRADAGEVHVPVRQGKPDSGCWAARASRCGFTSGCRWRSRRWRPWPWSGWPGPDSVRLRGALLLIVGLIVASIPILIYVYTPVWTEAKRLGDPLSSAALSLAGRRAEQSADPRRDPDCPGVRRADSWASRSRRPRADGPVSSGSFPSWSWWTCRLAAWQTCRRSRLRTGPSPPGLFARLKADPGFIRGVRQVDDKHSGEPGYASEPIDFLQGAVALDWSLPAAWGLSSSKGETPMISRPVARLLRLRGCWHRTLRHREREPHASSVAACGELSAQHPRGHGLIARNPSVLPRARLVGPAGLCGRCRGRHGGRSSNRGPKTVSRLIVEDPTRPLDRSAEVSGTARIVTDLPEQVVVETESPVRPTWSWPTHLIPAGRQPLTASPPHPPRLRGLPRRVSARRVTHGRLHLSSRPVSTRAWRSRSLGLRWQSSSVVPALAMSGCRRRPRSLAWSGRFRKGTFRWPWPRSCWFRSFGSRPGCRSPAIAAGTSSFHRFTWGAGIAAMKRIGSRVLTPPSWNRWSTVMGRRSPSPPDDHRLRRPQVQSQPGAGDKGLNFLLDSPIVSTLKC